MCFSESWITRNYHWLVEAHNLTTVQLPQVVRSVQRGVRWLKEYADSLVDARDIAITISALVAAEKNPHSPLVKRLASVLTRRQAVNGSWNDELWDTTWAASALVDVGSRIDDPPLQAALRFLGATQDPFSRTWYEEPFETMLVLDFVARTAPEMLQLFSDRPLKWVASLQNSEGCIVGMRYTGMAASLFCLTKRCGLTHGSKVVELALEYIRRDLKQKPIWTAAAWSNYYPLKALLDSGCSLDDPLVSQVVNWFLESQDSDGKWMQVSRVHDTAMSVIVLSSLLRTPLVDVATPRTAVLNANKENGTIRISFHGPGSGAITPAEKIKMSDQVRTELSHTQQLVFAAMGRVRGKHQRSKRTSARQTSVQMELEKAGKYAYGHLVPARIQLLLESFPSRSFTVGY